MLNKCVFLGRMVKDPEVKEVGESKVAGFAIAVDRNYKSKKEDAPTADFIPVNAWNKSAEFVSKYFKKGMPIVVVGSLETYSYETENGKRNGFRIKADEIYFAGGKKEDTKPETSSDDGFEFTDSLDTDLPF